MKKNCFALLTILLSFSHTVYSQLYGEYVSTDSTRCYPQTIRYCLGFGKGHTYDLILIFGNGELFSEKIISHGTFDLDFDTIFLKERKNGLELRFLMDEKGSLTPIKSISGLEGKTLKPFLPFFPEDPSRHVFGNRTLFPVKIANRYASSSDEFLILSEDHTYTYYCCDKVITEGTWKRKWNKLYLTDKNLDKPFIGILKNGRLEIFEDEMGAVE